MFVGHLSIGLIGKRAEPGISLGTWLLAVMLADLICFPLLIAGVEYFHGALGHIPYSHSLLTNVIWGALFAAGYCLLRRYPRGAWLLFAGVLSHWVLDVISHRPDMQLSPGISNVWGLGLWNSVPGTLIVEGGFWLLAIIVYVRGTSKDTSIPFRVLGRNRSAYAVMVRKHPPGHGSRSGAGRSGRLDFVFIGCRVGLLDECQAPAP